MNAKTFFIFVLLLILASFVSAKEDYAASSLSSVELCPCSNQIYAVNVQNTGTEASSYTVSAAGNAAKWVKITPEKLVLNAGQNGKFSVLVNSECSIEGNYNLEIYLRTDKSLTKLIKQKLAFSKCYDYSLSEGEPINFAEEKALYVNYNGTYFLCTNEKKIIPVLIE
ncbi:hypothetical protein HYX01_04565, partial [Candidatus Woesearchaeota archaeon]|nr:hypothetical protein [Candidatus Woesearchaeota archaeon]